MRPGGLTVNLDLLQKEGGKERANWDNEATGGNLNEVPRSFSTGDKGRKKWYENRPGGGSNKKKKLAPVNARVDSRPTKSTKTKSWGSSGCVRRGRWLTLAWRQNTHGRGEVP